MVTYTKPQSDCNDYGHRAVGSGQGSGSSMIDKDIIWEWPEDDWVSLGEHCKMNMWIRHNGELWIGIHAVRHGKIDTRQALCTYRVEVFDNGK